MKPRKYVAYNIPLHAQQKATLHMPRMITADDLNIIRAWLDICEEEIVAKCEACNDEGCDKCVALEFEI